MYINLFFLISTFLSLLRQVKTNKDGNCYVLALEGGGDKGAYQAGAIKGLIDSVPSGRIEWDVITGVSVGALNGAGLSIFAQGDEKTAVDFIINIWKNISGDGDIYKNWWLGPLYGLFFESGLYNTEPLDKLLSILLENKQLKRDFVIGSTNIETGMYERFSNENITPEQIREAILASTAFPVIFPNVQFRGTTYIDGGVKHSVDIAAGIHTCLDKGYAENKIVVDVILLNSKKLPQRDPKNFHPLQVLIRFLEISGFDNAMKDVDNVIDLFKGVNFRYIVSPTTALPSGYIPLNFSPAQIQQMIQLGVDDAKNAVQIGEGVSFRNINREYRQDVHNFYSRKGNDEIEVLNNLE
jgi:predicted patatin/cPLA2 family phospholipase